MLTLASLTLGLQLAGWLVGVLVVLFVMISVLLMLTILIQKPQGGGLSGAFGSGAGSGQTAFGAKTGDALTIATIGMFAVWVLFGVGLNFALTPESLASAKPTVTAPGAPTDSSNSGAAPADNKPADNKPADANKPANTGAPAEGTKPADGVTPVEGGTPAPAPAPAPATPPAPAGDKPADKPADQPAGKP